ncbi:MAG TPA: TetR/AcrR family transcriptional regulator [Solirubrobacterales bacterium]|nr:TetR/AcrR family transcriptional regulator [Solirubrobacterales bacterium]
MAEALERERIQRIRDELGDRSWHELGIEELASAAGLSRMTLHRRGVGKEEVRVALAELLAEEFRAAALPALAASGPAPDRLRAALEATCRVDERYLGLIEGLGDDLERIFHEGGDGEVLSKGSFTEAIRRILEDGAREGTLDPGADPEEKATLLFNAAGWTYRHMRRGHRWDPDRARSQVVGLLVAGARP